MCSCGLVTVAVAGALTLGCRPPRTTVPPATEAPPLSTAVQRATPQEAARTLLLLLRTEAQALARHDVEAAAAVRDQVAWYVVTREDIAARMPHGMGARGRDPVVLVARCVENWSAEVAYYADGLGLDQVRVEVPEREGYATVRVPARAGDSLAVLRISCVRGADGHWRVRGLQFAERATLPSVVLATQPVTRPTSAPASQP